MPKNKNLLLKNPDALVGNLENNIPGLLESCKVPGIVIGLIREAEVFKNLAFGVKNSTLKNAVTTRTIFEGASLSKPLFAYAALKLIDQGLIDLDTPLSNYLPEPYLPDETLAQQISMRHVLSHTTGFPNWRSDGEPLKVFFQPGDRYSYSGEGYVYLQKVLEHLLQQPLEDYLQQNLLGPLGMSNSSYIWNQVENEQLAPGHDEEGQVRKVRLWTEVNAAASLHTTVNDYTRFICEMLKTNSDLPESLNQQTREWMLTRQVQVNDSTSWHKDWPREKFKTNEKVGWGLGWGLQSAEDGESFWQWGDNSFYQAYVCGYPEQQSGLLILTNGKNGQKLIRSILKDIIGLKSPGLEWQDHLHQIQDKPSK
jgi:CubicO group peptidase (beta-lactamase class C family)